MDLTPRDIQSKFLERFGSEPLLIRAPGRINLIGEHTDYNGGFVMPAAVDKEIFFAVGPSKDNRTFLYSHKYGEELEVDLEDPARVESPQWANYLLGVLYQFRQRGYALRPFYCVFGGNVPPGAGMSSSAALECGFAAAMSELNLTNVPKLDIINIAQWAEHNYVGVKCGIMDQFASVMSKAGHVTVLDCRSLTHRYAPLHLDNHRIVLCDTKVKHALVDSAYNDRRNECESGVALLQKYYPEVKSLRDVTPEMLEEQTSRFEGKVLQRCQYVVGENNRVQQATLDLERGDLKSFGKKMFDTHEGLSRQYEVSCPELDFLVTEARKLPGVSGARMMGGGFGGCTINLVEIDVVSDFIGHMKAAYQKAFDIDMPVYEVDIVDGVGRVPEADLSLWT